MRAQPKATRRRLKTPLSTNLLTFWVFHLSISLCKRDHHTQRANKYEVSRPRHARTEAFDTSHLLSLRMLEARTQCRQRRIRFPRSLQHLDLSLLHDHCRHDPIVMSEWYSRAALLQQLEPRRKQDHCSKDPVGHHDDCLVGPVMSMRCRCRFADSIRAGSV